MSRSILFVVAVTLLLGVALSPPDHAQTTTGASPGRDLSRGPSLGVSATATEGVLAALTPRDGTPEGEGPPPTIRLRAEWSAIERVEGRYDWSALDALVDRMSAAGVRISLALVGGNAVHGGLPSPLRGTSLDAWLAFVRRAARRYAGKVELIEIQENLGPASGYDATTYGFVLKNSALAVRAEADAAGHTLHVAQGSIRGDALDWQRALWREDAAAYVDVLPVVLSASDPPEVEELRIQSLVTEGLMFPPAAPLWVLIESGGATPADQAASALVALSTGASAALLQTSGETSDADLTRWALGTHEALRGYGPAPLGKLSVTDETGAPIAGGAALARFFSSETFATLLFYAAPGEPEDFPSDRLVLASSIVRNARILDPVTGQTRRTATTPLEQGGLAARIPRSPLPRALIYDKPAAQPGLDVPTEEVETRGTRELTAEEIIARFQQVQRIQDDRLERWTATGRTELHFKIATGGATVDVGIDANYFWERGGFLEWEQTAYFLNGNRIGWKTVPELPLIQPEKVATLPLDITLDRTYRYRRVGRATVGDRPAYVLEFSPDEAEGESLYRGRVWIDEETFVRLRLNVVQTNLEAPVLSNEETQTLEPLEGPDGETYWMVTKIDSQQIWRTAGRNFIVRREQFFDEIDINTPTARFEEIRDEAYASNNRMQRDTEIGVRYLKRNDDGSRTVKLEQDTSQLFVGGGAFKDRSRDSVTPLGGVNYFDYDLFGKGIQANAFFAGVLGFFTLSDPDFLGSNLDATVNSTLSAIEFSDEVFVGDREVLVEQIDQKSQNVSFQLGIPAGAFWKFNLGAGARYRDYSDNEDQRDALRRFNNDPMATQSLRFELPRDHLEVSGDLGVEFNRKGWSMQAFATHFERGDWEEWGLYDDLAQTYVEFDPTSSTFVPTAPAELQDSYQRWGLTAFREFYLKGFHKVRGEVNYLDGSSLDRFSRYQFSLFGNTRLNGFSGSGVRFDQGLLARAGYSFNLFEAVQFDVVLEGARVDNVDLGIEGQRHSGIGLSGNFVAPWKTVVSFSWGYSLTSDIPELEGQSEFLVLVLKLF